jgi:hypothetical protein
MIYPLKVKVPRLLDLSGFCCPRQATFLAKVIQVCKKPANKPYRQNSLRRLFLRPIDYPEGIRKGKTYRIP